MSGSLLKGLISWIQYGIMLLTWAGMSQACPVLRTLSFALLVNLHNCTSRMISHLFFFFDDRTKKKLSDPASEPRFTETLETFHAFPSDEPAVAPTPTPTSSVASDHHT